MKYADIRNFDAREAEETPEEVRLLEALYALEYSRPEKEECREEARDACSFCYC